MRQVHILPTLLLVFVASFAMTAQESKTSVILYNSEPYLAEINTNGEILNLIEKKPNYLRGYQVSPSNVAPVTYADASESTAPDLDGEAVSRDRKFIDFKADYATLSDLSVQRLERVKAYLDNNSFAKVLVTAHLIDESANSQKLASNRLDSCKKYLELKGISPERILVSSVYAPSMKDKVAISYIR